MYNRYIPQADGSYRRSRVPDTSQNAAHTPPIPRSEKPPQECPSAPEPEKPPVCQTVEPPCRQSNPRCPRSCSCSGGKSPPPPPKHENKEGSIGNFLKQLLPKDFDTGDLLVVILLLLMSADCAEDQNTALLTLALYLFM